ncbi:MAG TPA: group II intron reverse transcriptase/maturase [Candidatus Acidoferrales bacterium]|jgi:RNA-directed DNA polymerase|nr:group II intron reverse transcriptase/maturase [Candidatus Acidoferrales bacterium]
MSLQTPIKIRTLQRKLYSKAKEEPTYRFYLLYDKVYREDVLAHAYDLAKTNHGAPGVDGQTFEMVESGDLEKWLEGIRKELRDKTYKPQPVRRVMIPKPGGGERPLGIPTIRDRTVQAAAKLVLEPIFEADLEPEAYGYRPKRSAHDAIKKVHQLLCEGYTDVVDADLSKYFDKIPHRELLQSIARRIVDRDVLHLLKMWLKVPVEERDEKGNRRLTGGRKNNCGTPQGGVVSPMLANLYMNRFLKYWRMSGQKERLQAHVVNYADDFVILSRGKADQALNWTRGVVTKLGLTLNEAKTSIKEARSESFNFLGYTFGPHRYRKDGHWYLGASPSKKSVARLRGKVGDLLGPNNVGSWPEVRDKLNSMLQGWANYFSYGTRLMAYRAVDNYVLERVRHFLKRRHKVQSRGALRYSDNAVFGELGVLRLRHVHVGALPSASK